MKVIPPLPRYASGKKEVVWHIVPAGGSFELVDDQGVVARTGPKPRKLSDWALENGATHVDWSDGVPWD